MLYTPAPVILMTAVELDGPHIISILTGEEGDSYLAQAAIFFFHPGTLFKINTCAEILSLRN